MTKCPTMRPRRVRLPPGTCRVYLKDEAPQIGAGWRLLEPLSIGPKWTRLRDVSTDARVRLPRATWAEISRRGVRTLS